MDKPVSPCRAECPDRNEHCHNESCPHGWAMYEKRMAEYRDWRAAQAGSGAKWMDGSPMTAARRAGVLRELRKKNRRRI